MTNIRLNKLAEQKIYPNIGVPSGNTDDFFYKEVQKIKENPIREHSVEEGIIIANNGKFVLVSIGSKSEGKIKIQEFENPESLEVGTITKAYVERVEDMDGNIALSRTKAIKQELWDKYVKLFETKATIEGEVKHVAKSGGGGVVEFEDGMRAFLPISHADMRTIENLNVLIGVKLGFRILSMDSKQNSIAVSRKLVLNELHAEARNEYVAQLKEGQIIEDGIVKSVTNYGVFIQIHESDSVGVVDGLLYVGDISWSKKKIHPSLLFKRRQKVRVKVIGVDKETGKISLGYKQLTPNPWQHATIEFPAGSMLEGKVSYIDERGVYVELSSVLEGFIDNQELSGDKLNLSQGQVVKVKVLEVDSDQQVIKLSMKRFQANQTSNTSPSQALGKTIEGEITSITENQIEVQLNSQQFQNLKGRVRLENISWEEDPKVAINKYKLGEKIQGKLLEENIESGFLDLGIKQLVKDPFKQFLNDIQEGEIIEALVIKIEESKMYIQINPQLELFVKKDSNFLDFSQFEVGNMAKFKILKKEEYNIIFSPV